MYAFKIKIIIVSIFVTFLLLNLYSLLVNGLRQVDQKEKNNKSLPMIYECDVQVEYKSVYFYIMVPYVCVAIIIPLLLICFFNISITRELAKHKNNPILKDLLIITANATASPKIAKTNSAQKEISIENANCENEIKTKITRPNKLDIRCVISNNNNDAINKNKRYEEQHEKQLFLKKVKKNYILKNQIEID